jgi:hypothetical protein
VSLNEQLRFVGITDNNHRALNTARVHTEPRS